MSQPSHCPHLRFYKIRFTEVKPCVHLELTAILSWHLTKLVHWKMLIPERHAIFVYSSTPPRSLKLTWCSSSWHLSLFLYLEWRSQSSRGWTLRHSRDKTQSTKCWYHVTSRMFQLEISQLSSRISAAAIWYGFRHTSPSSEHILSSQPSALRLHVATPP
jgi:hypothetical protein